MKKRYLLIGGLAFVHAFAKAQKQADSIPPKVTKTQIELVYNHYIQDGDNSAVTGGIGTEELTVYGPSLKLKKKRKNNTWSVNLGVDIVSSASTDNIDFIPSSVSQHDIRYYSNGTFEKNIDKSRLTLIGGAGFSIESDYTSLSAKFGVVKKDKSELKTFSAIFQYFNDDLRWGRFNNREPDEQIELIYPVELRATEWHDIHKRYSYNLKLGYEQVLNKRNVLGLFPELTLQNGLLSTPFHRIFFSDDSRAVENLPENRFKLGLAVKLNSFVGGSVILKNTLSFYDDDFGISALSFGNETVIKISPIISIMPTFRLYSQSESKYFAPFQGHEPGTRYYASDFDLSEFNSFSAGVGFGYSPARLIRKNIMFSTLIFRYSFFNRSNGLTAHTFSLALQADFYKKQKGN